MHPIKLGNRRLLKLSDKLDSLIPDRFNYGHWVGDDWKGHQDLSCGTTACAFGWAPSIPSFQKAGLRLKRYKGEIVVTIKHSRVKRDLDDDNREAAMGHTLRTAQTFFNLTEDEAHFLFVPGSRREVNGRYVEAPDSESSAKAVAKHIRKFVAHRAKTLEK